MLAEKVNTLTKNMNSDKHSVFETKTITKPLQVLYAKHVVERERKVMIETEQSITTTTIDINNFTWGVLGPLSTAVKTYNKQKMQNTFKMRAVRTIRQLRE